MDAYIFQAALLCGPCGEAKREQLNGEATARHAAAHGDDHDASMRVYTLAEVLGFDPENEEEYDSGNYPKGPYPNGGGEADYAAHCDACGVALENPLTEEGRESEGMVECAGSMQLVKYRLTPDPTGKSPVHTGEARCPVCGMVVATINRLVGYGAVPPHARA